MQDLKHALWVRLVLGVLAALILMATLPAYLNTSSNPGLAVLSGEAASLGSVAGVFLGRQMALALIAIYGAIKGTTQPMLIGAFGMAFFNLHDAIFITAFAGVKPGGIAGLVLGLIALFIMWTVHRRGSAN